MVGLSGASLNPQLLPNFTALNDIRQARITESAERKIKPRPPVPQRVLPIQQTVEAIVLGSDHPMRLAEIQPLAEQVLGQPLKRTAIKSALGVLAQNKSPVVRVSRGLYSHAIVKQSSKTQNQKQHE